MPRAILNKSKNAMKVYQINSKSVYTVIAGESTDSIINNIDTVSLGSAVAISSNYLLTNCHLFEDKPVIVIFHGDNFQVAEICYAEPESDRCYIKTQEHNLHPIQGIRSFNNLNVGEPVYTIGAPQGLELTLGEGIISGLRNNGTINYIQTTAPISPGSSGGGLFDSYGNLIGITTFFADKSQNLNFAIAAEEYWH